MKLAKSSDYIEHKCQETKEYLQLKNTIKTLTQKEFIERKIDYNQPLLNTNMKPYKTWNKEDLAKQLKNQIEFYNLPLWVDKLLDEALNDESFNPIKDFDGCTIVQDPDHPCLACYLHDYHWVSGRGGWLSNLIFQKILKLTKVSNYQRFKNFAGVTAGWYVGYKWVHLLKGNVKSYSKAMLDAKGHF